MATTGLSYSELSGDAKEVALNSFINFYVDQYRRGSLEILSSQVSNELMATINQILRDNAFMGHQELVNVSTRLSKPAYQKILAALPNVKFHEDGEPVVSMVRHRKALRRSHEVFHYNTFVYYGTAVSIKRTGKRLKSIVSRWRWLTAYSPA